MSGRQEPAGRPRQRLTRAHVLRAAVALADKEGIAGLSMRRLGDKLGIEAMSLYNHVGSKDDLIDGMVDLVFDEIGTPPPDGDWRSALRERALRTRDALTRHRWAIGLMESRGRPGPATVRHHDAVLGRLRNAGFSIASAAHAYSVLDSYIYGFALTQLNLPYRTPEEGVDVAENILQQLPRDELPHLAELLDVYAKQPGYKYADEFEYGLDLVLDGLARIRSRGRRTIGGDPTIRQGLRRRRGLR